jgi:cellulose synthase/poly-beta-1,6-N-acetylglucosamine synthase-like glycosyltransferase
VDPVFGTVILVPARNEEEGLLSGLGSIAQQTEKPDLILVVVNNSTDRTEEIARDFAARPDVPTTQVLVLPINPHKKAGALNAGIRYIQQLTGKRLEAAARRLMVMDADTELHPSFIMRAVRVLNNNPRLGGVSAACRGRQIPTRSLWRRFLYGMQRIEYGRYAYARIRRNVHTMSGAGSFYRTSALQDVIDWRGDVFWENDRNLVEDYETTLTLKESGWSVTANQWCIAYTDLMPTLRDLVRQRQRWTRGAIDILRDRGITKHTWQSFAILILELSLLMYGMTWVFTSTAPWNRSDFNATYLTLVLFWPLYWAFTVRHLGWRSVVVQLLIIPELLFSLVHMYWLVTSVAKSYLSRRRPATWTE